MITINNEQCDHQIKIIGKEVKKYNKHLEKDFGKWREEERVICSEMNPSSDDKHLDYNYKAKRVHISKITYHDEYEFPINPVLYGILYNM